MTNWVLDDTFVYLDIAAKFDEARLSLDIHRAEATLILLNEVRTNVVVPHITVQRVTFMCLSHRTRAFTTIVITHDSLSSTHLITIFFVPDEKRWAYVGLTGAATAVVDDVKAFCSTLYTYYCPRPCFPSADPLLAFKNARTLCIALEAGKAQMAERIRKNNIDDALVGITSRNITIHKVDVVPYDKDPRKFEWRSIWFSHSALPPHMWLGVDCVAGVWTRESDEAWCGFGITPAISAELTDFCRQLPTV